MNTMSSDGVAAQDSLADLVEEITDKLRAGVAVDVDAYVARYPERAAQIRELLPALHMLAAAGRRPTRRRGPPPTSCPMSWHRLRRRRRWRHVRRRGRAAARSEAGRTSAGWRSWACRRPRHWTTRTRRASSTAMSSRPT